MATPITREGLTVIGTELFDKPVMLTDVDITCFVKN